MSQAEELLNSMSEEVPVHTHPVPDTDTYFIIDPITRQIENTNRKKTVIMQYDHNSERFTFELPRYIDGHDMLECTSVTVNVDNIETGVEEPRVNSDAPDMTDLRVHPNDPEKVISSWLISRNSTQLAGILSFHIEYKCTDSNGNVVYEWSTDTYDEIEIRARKKNGEAVVAEYTDVLEQWRASIFGAGASVMANIAAEGETQVAAVKAESETQQEAVELKGTQSLESIPEDYTETNIMADEAVRSKADAVVCEAAGESIVLKDSSNDHVRGLRLFGKTTQITTNGYQLFDASRLKSVSNDYTSIINNGDGSFTVTGSGVATAGIASKYSLTHKETVELLKPGKLYANFETKTRPYLDIAVMVNGSPVTSITNYSSYKASTEITQEMLDNETTYLLFTFYLANGAEIVPGTIKPMLYQDGDGSWEPYSDGVPSPSPEYPQELTSVESHSISVHGKNLIPFPYTESTVTKNGITFTVNDDGSIHLAGTATKVSVFSVFQGELPLNGVYTLSGVSNDVIPSTHYMQPYVNGVFKDAQISGGRSYEINGNLTQISLYVKSGETVDTMVYPQLEIGGLATEYESPTTQTMAAVYSLPGIPVTSGGNYTDSDGQQWICDEIDLERGVYMQRVANLVVDETSDVRMNVAEDGKTNGYAYRYFLNLNNIMINSESIMCDRLVHKNVNTLVGNSPENVGIAVSPVYSCIYLNVSQHMTEDTVDACKAALSNYPLTVNYILATPIETPLTAEEIAAFKALRTNYPNTTILNDAGAWMSVKYNADTKTYVENPKTLKLVDSSTGVVYELKIVDGDLTVVQV